MLSRSTATARNAAVCRLCVATPIAGPSRLFTSSPLPRRNETPVDLTEPEGTERNPDAYNWRKRIRHREDVAYSPRDRDDPDQPTPVRRLDRRDQGGQNYRFGDRLDTRTQPGARTQSGSFKSVFDIPNKLPGGQHQRQVLKAEDFLPPLPPNSGEIAHMIAGHLSDFKDSQRLLERIADYGLENTQIRPLVAAWAKQETERLRNATTHTKAAQILALEGWDEKSIRQSLIGGPEGNTFTVEIEAKMTRRFVRFASQSDMVSEQSRRHLTTLLDTTDMTRIIYSSPWLPARQTSRQFHLHIGPTNSGKTYNALKALSKAETGAYAGPLRLLAHEVWERINLGSVGELNGVGRKCNLITGEEKRIVAPDAGLVSCTVEMLPASGPSNEPFDVVVIDEIQMIGDSSRGGAWTAALMGVQAKEIHLCGDETTLELLQELLPSMGDEIQIHRYERLTPLRVAEESLGGDISKVETGDCVVTFSRNNIFAVKQQIESGAAKKCAVIYGALPPEVRADQAKIFNEDEGIAEVLVASDAVGMGLNLRIKRIVFESIQKFNGKRLTPLAITQIKQIAGRAGRFGMQRKADDVYTPSQITSGLDTPEVPPEVAYEKVKAQAANEAGGVVTTLHAADLPILREVLQMPLPAVQRAVFDIPSHCIENFARLLPPSTPYARVLEHMYNLAALYPNTVASDYPRKFSQADVAELYRDELSLQEIHLFSLAPVNVRDPYVFATLRNIIKNFARNGLVTINHALAEMPLLKRLDEVEATLAILPPLPPIIGIGRKVLTPPIIVECIPQMESLHKSLVLYIWLSYRIAVAMPDRPHALVLKARCEKVLEECLERFPGMRNLKHTERTKEGDRAVADWRKENVAPNGTKKLPGWRQKGVLWVKEAVRQRLINKQVWASTGIPVPREKWLAEIDGKGPVKNNKLIGDGKETERAPFMIEGRRPSDAEVDRRMRGNH